MLTHIGKANNLVRAVVLFLPAAALFMLAPADLVWGVHSQTKRPRRPGPRTAVTSARYSAFPHNVKAHGIECSSCHKFPSSNWKTVRPAADAFPDITEYPRHESCLDCHRQQFFRGARPAICTICHTVATPRGSPRHPFPNPREIFDASAKGKTAQSDFEISFPHDKHIDIVSQVGAARSVFIKAAFAKRTTAEESCAVCHKTLQPQGVSDVEFVTKPPADLGEGFWLKKGTFKTAPTGHTTCFTCHSQDSGLEPAPTSCATCHKIKQNSPAADFDPKLAARIGVSDRVTLDAWRSRHSAGKFRHEWVSHADLSCSTCHTVEKMNTLDPATKKVPITGCNMCHTTATVDDGGALNYEADQRAKNAAFQCIKCHITFGRLPIPESHLAALAAAK